MPSCSSNVRESVDGEMSAPSNILYQHLSRSNSKSSNSASVTAVEAANIFKLYYDAHHCTSSSPISSSASETIAAGHYRPKYSMFSGKDRASAPFTFGSGRKRGLGASINGSDQDHVHSTTSLAARPSKCGRKSTSKASDSLPSLMHPPALPMGEHSPAQHASVAMAHQDESHSSLSASMPLLSSYLRGEHLKQQKQPPLSLDKPILLKPPCRFRNASTLIYI